MCPVRDLNPQQSLRRRRIYPVNRTGHGLYYRHNDLNLQFRSPLNQSISFTIGVMNLLLLRTDQIKQNIAIVSGRQFDQLSKVHRAEIGDSVRVGEINGLMGTGIIMAINKQSATIQVDLHSSPPTALPLTLILALPRPKMLRRIIQTIAAMGVKKLYLVNSHRVEKSFWQTAFLQSDALREQLILGLEQARDTHMPEIILRKLFKPFVEDELGEIITGTNALVAQPSSQSSCPVNSAEPISLAIGPEGGFIPYEIEKLNQIGFQSVHLGPRILRVENAVPALISRLYPA